MTYCYGNTSHQELHCHWIHVAMGIQTGSVRSCLSYPGYGSLYSSAHMTQLDHTGKIESVQPSFTRSVWILCPTHTARGQFKLLAVCVHKVVIGAASV